MGSIFSWFKSGSRARAPAGLSTLDWITLAMPLGLIAGILLMMYLPSKYELIGGACVVVCFLTFVSLVPVCLMRSYFRRPHAALLWVWAPVCWIPAWPSGRGILSLLEGTLSRMHLVQAFMLMWLGLSVIAVIAFMFLARRFRSDSLILLSVIWITVLFVLAGVGVFVSYVFISQIGWKPALRECREVAFVWAVLTVPSVICLIILKVKGRYGTGPADERCNGCEYDLTGSVIAGQTICPECGAATSAVQQEYIRGMVQSQPAAG
jgi:hypothetical protein